MGTGVLLLYMQLFMFCPKLINGYKGSGPILL